MHAATRVALLTALALATSSAQLVADIGLIAADGTEEVLSDGETIVQSADAGYTSLFCKSTEAWDQCIWLWKDRSCVYLEGQDVINTCPDEMGKDFNTCKLETGERSDGLEWTCLLIVFDNQNNITDEKSIELDYAEVATVAVNNTEAPLTLLIGETVVLECVASSAYPEAHLVWTVDGLETQESDSNSTDCDESGQQCETRLSIFYQADAEGNSLLECVSKQTDSFGQELLVQAAVTIQKVTTLIERWTTTEILLLVFLILLIFMLLILLILAIIYGWCCFAKKKRQTKELPDTKSMVGPPPPPMKVAEYPRAPPVYSIEDARKQNSVAPPLPPKEDRSARDFQSKAEKYLDSDDYFDDEERHRKKKRRKIKKRPPTDSTEGLTPLPLKVFSLADFAPTPETLARDFAADDELLVYAWEGRGIGNGSVAGSLSTLDGEESHVDDIDFEEGFRATLGDAFGRVWHGITADDSEEGEEEEDEQELDGVEGPETWI